MQKIEYVVKFNVYFYGYGGGGKRQEYVTDTPEKAIAFLDLLEKYLSGNLSENEVEEFSDKWCDDGYVTGYKDGIVIRVTTEEMINRSVA